MRDEGYLMEDKLAFVQTLSGKLWLLDDRDGQEWLETEEGSTWLETEDGKAWSSGPSEQEKEYKIIQNHLSDDADHGLSFRVWDEVSDFFKIMIDSGKSITDDGLTDETDFGWWSLKRGL